MAGKPTFVLDAEVLIDYRDSDLEILGLVARHVARLIALLKELPYTFTSRFEEYLTGAPASNLGHETDRELVRSE